MRFQDINQYFRTPLSWGAAFVFASSSLHAAPAGPSPQIPEGGKAPGAFPNTSVTAVNVIAKGSSSAFNGSVEVPGLDGQGPIGWSVNRYNRGDIALRLAPNDATAALSNLGQGFIEFGDGAPTVPANQAWRPQPQFGVIIPTVRQNGPINWNDGEGAFFPTIALSESSSGPGFSMVDGSFGNGDLDINLGRAGTHSSSPEANFNFSATWFPYDQGWIGGEVGAPDAATGVGSWTRPTAHSVGLTPGSIKWTEFPAGSATYGGVADLVLPGINALTSGMLFAASSDGASDLNILGVAPKEDGSGWIVTIREDSATDAETLAPAGQSEFQFVYIPYDAKILLGGYINGEDAAKQTAKGDFSISRTAAGTYELTIPGKTGSQGTLLLQVADFEPGTSAPLASRAFLSYEFRDGKFVIQARKTASDTTADLVDVDFYFAWVDFQNPLAMPDGPRLRSLPTVMVSAEGVTSKEANIAVNTDAPEILVTSTDDGNTGGYTDANGQVATAALVGYFYDPRTLTRIGEPFPIVLNPAGTITKHDVKYNPVSKQYVVVANAQSYNAAGKPVLRIALVNPSAVAGNNSPVAKVFSYDENNENDYQDVAVAVSSKNGNFIIASEYKFPEDGDTDEDVVAALFDKGGNLLTPQAARLDRLQSADDVDDPDVVYLEKKDVFLYVTNTDEPGALVNRVVGSIIQTVPDQNGAMQVQAEQVLGDGLPAGAAEGHPASFENPFNGELITAFDVGGNAVGNGHISFYNIGPAPGYSFTVARPEIPYLSTTEMNVIKHNHPQIAADLNSGVIAIGHNSRDSVAGYPNGYVFSLYDSNGAPLPSLSSLPYFLADANGLINNGPNLHNIKYSPASDSFLVVFQKEGDARVTYLTGFQVTSDHLSGGEKPTLAVVKAGNSIELTWPSGSGYVLESSDRLQPANWTAVADNPAASGGSQKVTISPDGAMKFYRLRR